MVPWAPKSSTQMAILISSAIDRQTDRPRYSVCNSRPHLCIYHYGPFSGTARVSRCQKKSSSGLYGAREDNRGRHTDNPAERHSIRTNQRPTSIIPPFLRQMPFLSVYVLSCIATGLVQCGLIIVLIIGKKVKASHTRYRALGLELILAVSPQVTVSHPPGGRLPLLSARPAVTSPAAEHHRPLAGTKLYCLVTEAHRCKQLAQGCYALCSVASSRI